MRHDGDAVRRGGASKFIASECIIYVKADLQKLGLSSRDLTKEVVAGGATCRNCGLYAET